MILDDNGFFYRGLFQYNKNTKDYISQSSTGSVPDI